MKNVHGILKNWLSQNGYEGLYTEDCGCDLDDLIACDSYCGNCMPGIKLRYKDMTYEQQQEYGFSEWIIKEGKI